MPQPGLAVARLHSGWRREESTVSFTVSGCGSGESVCCRNLNCPLPALQAVHLFIFLQPFLCRHVPEAMQLFRLFASTSPPVWSSAVPSWSPWSPSLSSCPCCQEYLPYSAWFPLHDFPHAVDSYFPSLSHVLHFYVQVSQESYAPCSHVSHSGFCALSVVL